MTGVGPEETRPNGHPPNAAPHFTTAEDVNPPLPGDPGYDDYVERRAKWMRWVDEQRAMMPRSELTFTAFHDAGLGRMVTPEDPAPAPNGDVVELATRSGDPSSDGVPAEARPWRRTDAANGELFAQLYGGTIRYDHRRGRWLSFEDHRWHVDEVDGVRLLAKDAARLRYHGASAIDDLGERAREASFAIKSEDRSRLEALLIQARAEPPIADAGDRWDLDPWLVGVANGVVDLRSGGLRAGRPEDRITLHTAIDFDAEAACSRWERFLVEIFDGDEELIGFIQRAVGYSLTGDMREQVLFLCHGVGANGKSVLLTILRAVAGTYAYNAPFSTFELRNRASIPNDLATLGGRRLVTASEVSENARFNEARIKGLTGGDKQTARFLHAEFFEFEPVLKLWLAVNHLPVVLDDSHGFWRRVREIPFRRRFDEDADPGLIDALRAELPGILAWAVRGALAWREHGLGTPDAVVSATATYRADSDPLADFLSDHCVVADGLETRARSAYADYRGWAEAEGMREREILSNKAFGTRMTARFTKIARNYGKVYLGVGLRRATSSDGSGDGS